MFLPDHRTPVAHAEWARSPRGLREVEMKTPNREQLGAEFWWWSVSTNRTAILHTNDLTRKHLPHFGGLRQLFCVPLYHPYH